MKGYDRTLAPLTKITLVVVLAMSCVGIFDHSLWTPDEPRVAEISRQMSVSGDYLIPLHARQPFLEQPPLYYATAALCFKLFGADNEGYGRLASALYGILTLLVVFVGVRRAYTQTTATLAVAVLASSALFFQVHHKMLVDSALCFFITFALFGFFLASREQCRHGFGIFWLGTALAFLTKGFIGVAIPGVAVAGFMLWQRDFGIIRRMHAAAGVLLLLGFIALWTWILYRAGGKDFLWSFYVFNHVGRFLDGGVYTGGHVRPFYFYLSDFWVQGAPWSLLLIPFFITARPFDATKRFFCVWFLSGIALLSLAETKRGLYLLPLMPAMAVMAAIWMSDLSRRMPQVWERTVLFILGGIFILCLFVLPFAYVRFLGGPWSVAASVMIACLLAVWFIHYICRPDPAGFLTVCWCILLLLWTPAVFPQIDQHKSYKNLFVQMGRIVAAQPVAGYRLSETFEALAPFYGGFYVENIEDRRIFEQYLARKDSAYAMILPSRLDAGLKRQLEQNGTPLINAPTRMRKDIELWKIGQNMMK